MMGNTMKKLRSTKALMRCGTALAGIAGAVAIAGLTASPAHAVPAYGYAMLEFTNFKLENVVGAPGVTGLTPVVNMTTGANYLSEPPGGNSATGNLVTGVNALQATSGTGPFPGQNVFSQQLVGAAGTRGDGLITGAIAVGATSTLVSEGNLPVGPGSAGSSAGSTTTIQATFTAILGTPIILSFDAAVSMLANVGSLGDNATSLMSATFSIQDLTTGNYISICATGTLDCTIAGGNKALATVAPAELNNTIGTVDPANPASFSLAPKFFSFTSEDLDPGHVYKLVLGDSTQVILSTIPEPISLALLGTGLLGLGVIRRRQRR